MRRRLRCPGTGLLPGPRPGTGLLPGSGSATGLLSRTGPGPRLLPRAGSGTGVLPRTGSGTVLRTGPEEVRLRFVRQAEGPSRRRQLLRTGSLRLPVI